MFVLVDRLFIELSIFHIITTRTAFLLERVVEYIPIV